MNKEYKTKVIQFGEGNFLRAFADWMIEESNEKLNKNTGVYVIQPRDNDNIYKLKGQDYKYHVNIMGQQKDELIDEVVEINCITGGLNTHKEYDKFLELATDPEIEVVISNTTEAGIIYDQNDDRYDISPSTFPAKLTSFLYSRYEAIGTMEESELVVLPCELIENNGYKLKETVIQYAELWDLEDGFKDWIDKEIRFVNTLVDRIVPGYPKDNPSIVEEKIKKTDDFYVVAEPFHLWVIEDESIGDILDLKKSGLNIIYTDDLTPYRDMKVKILNGAHTGMVAIGILSGLDTVSEVLDDKIVGEFIKDTIYNEIVPTIDYDSATVEEYAEDTLDRFSNPYIRHELSDIALNSISKFKVRILPTILDYYDKYEKPPLNLIKSLSALIVLYNGKNDIKLRDDKFVIKTFEDLWDCYYIDEISLEDLVIEVLKNKDFWGMDLTSLDSLESNVVKYTTAILNSKIDTLIQ